MSVDRTWKTALGTRVPEAWGREIRHLRDPDRAAQEGEDRGEALRRDPAPTRVLRAALRQRPAPRRREDAGPGLSVEGHHQGSQHDVGRPGDAADQGSLRAAHRRSARRPRRGGRGVLGPDPARHDPAGLPAPLRAHRRHARPAAAAGRRRGSRRARRAATPFGTSPPAPTRASAARRRSTSPPTRRP